MNSWNLATRLAWSSYAWSMLTGSTARLYLSNEKEASHGMLLSFSTSFTCYQLMVNKDEYISIVCGLNGFWMCLLAAMLAGRRYCPDTGGEPGDGGHRGPSAPASTATDRQPKMTWLRAALITRRYADTTGWSRAGLSTARWRPEVYELRRRSSEKEWWEVRTNSVELFSGMYIQCIYMYILKLCWLNYFYICLFNPAVKLQYSQ